jgi:hypothetical protein
LSSPLNQGQQGIDTAFGKVAADKPSQLVETAYLPVTVTFQEPGNRIGQL